MTKESQKKIWQEEKAQLQKDKQAQQQIVRRPVNLKLARKPGTGINTTNTSPTESIPDDLLRRQLGI
jgi:hypothetical protein